MNDFLSEEFEIHSTPSKVHKEELKLPTNVKQIGTIEDGIQIYLEDYVYTYLYQYARNNPEKEKLAVLLGKSLEQEGQTILMISGAIQGKFSTVKNGNVIFTDDTWEYVKSKQKEYFEDMDIIGWMHTQPGYGIFLTSHHIHFHKETFPKQYQVLYVIDPIEKNDSFFIWQKDQLKESMGYFIYYDRNDKMHNYMLDNRVVKPKDDTDEVPEEDVIYRYRQQDRSKRQEIHQKKVINMLVSLCGILGLICLVMGIGLMNNLERITNLESEINNMDSTYTNLFTQLKGDDIQAVMAEIVPVDEEKGETEDESQKENAEESASGQKKETEQQPANSSNTEEDTKNIEQIEEPATEELEKEVEEPKEDVKEEPVAEESVEEMAQQEQQEVKTEPKTEAEPETKIEPEKEENYETYTIKTGDSLNRISYQYYKTLNMVDEIMRINGISNPNKILVGQKIKLPQP